MLLSSQAGWHDRKHVCLIIYVQSVGCSLPGKLTRERIYSFDAKLNFYDIDNCLVLLFVNSSLVCFFYSFLEIFQ